jgi:serine/threonine-protein kinase
VKVLDFGLAKLRHGENNELTLSGVAGGTPAFMAPEAALAKESLDGRADLYSLGAVGYWLLTGKLVFDGETAYATVMDHIRKAPVQPSRRTELEIPEELDRIIMSCLEKNPANRPPDAKDLAQQLRRIPLVQSWTQERAEQWWHAHKSGALKPCSPVPEESPAIELTG